MLKGDKIYNCTRWQETSFLLITHLIPGIQVIGETRCHTAWVHHGSVQGQVAGALTSARQVTWPQREETKYCPKSQQKRLRQCPSQCPAGC